MAAEKKDKKRKAASSSSAVETDPPSKKSKKSFVKNAKAPTETKSKGASKDKKPNNVTNGKATKPLNLDNAPARDIKPRKRAADFLSDEEDEITKRDKKDALKDSASVTNESVKRPKKKAKEEAKATTTTTEKVSLKKDDANAKEKKESFKKSKKEVEVRADNEHESEDDQTLALIRGFDSSGEEDISGDEGFEPGQAVPQIPDSKQVKRKIRKLKKNHTDEPEEPGTVYIGRIPHGFYEHEMRAYFSQFGDITRLRMSRNRTTGRSKHYGYIEFASESVAKIVADTMDNYLMFGHILKCKFVPQDQLHPETFKCANRRFKSVPWNQIEKKQLELANKRPVVEEDCKGRIEESCESRENEGFSVDGVPAQKTLAQAKTAIEDDNIEAPKAIEAPPKAITKPDAQEELKKATKKSKKSKDSANASAKKADAPVSEQTKEATHEKPAKIKEADTRKAQNGETKSKKDKRPKAKTPTVVADNTEKPSKSNPSEAKDPKGKEIKDKLGKVEKPEKSKKSKKSKA
ncbi:MKI67 FHA domain-interacting nucleolar phosphoprotein [Coccidioides immitis RMSCC 2394]|uniref:MKI67 FHA domain-interacting nucleolar phosphoprotein n=1 Tax=Coccidioides immitis RMSCC 2394 TaxID=404692 RepID=A0A0J6YMQ7_COCIT|nr:MKI67 FHA domain-interacting nucleolar phosphoprotein [Coccidioides immitis RMSCC 2394]